MYRSRVLQPRPDLRLLAQRLDAAEGAAGWQADPPGALTPVLRRDGGSSLTAERVVAEVRAFLAGAAPAWDPFHPV